ncbi:MAG: Type 1 glutamine amidotransferase-like domain-containing protein [Acidobacteria bacterium]|nr:Type 1 glutamine amidotransferase-like domain-containing protein [Acidobacteriota bacterium]
MKWPRIGGIAALVLLLGSAGCGSGGTPNGSSSSTSSPQSSQSGSLTPVLLFTGVGTSAPDVSAVQAMLDNLKLSYSTVNSAELEAISDAQLKTSKLLIVPGGNSIMIGQNLSAAATAKIRNAVEQDGLHYLGICAGAFFAGSSIYNGVDLTSGVWFNFYADENKGIHLEALNIALSNGSLLDVYWQDGPQLSGWGEVVAEFPDGTPAIVEGGAGNGFVVLTGVHLEAPANWRTGLTFTTPLAVDLAYAGTVIQSALNGNPLPHF